MMVKVRECPSCGRTAYMVGGICEFCQSKEEGQSALTALSDMQIKEAMAVIYDTVQAETVVIYDVRGQPIFTRFANLSAALQTQGFEGLKDRIQREGLSGYIQRKRSTWGDNATNAVIRNLKARRLIV